ncbi:MAG: FecCD family ABC transporter permease [Cellulosilyticaceae bacterium]
MLEKEGIDLDKRKYARYTLACIGLVLLGIGLVLSLSIGAKSISFQEIKESLAIGEQSMNYNIIRDVRLPRALAATLVGGFLAVSGAIMQGITRNPIAEPSVMGITQGATFTVAVAFVIQRINPAFTLSSTKLMLFAFIGAGISGILVYIVSSRRRGKIDTVKLALAGTALGTLLISLATGLTMATNLSQQLGFWLSGGFAGVSWEGVKLLLFVGSIGVGTAFFMAPKITILSLGEEVAIGLGQKTNLVRFACIIIVIGLTGASVAVGGNIIFVGLVIPQIVKKIVGSDYKHMMPSTFIFGSVLLVYGDILARTINAPYETPIGALTAVLGVPIFIYLIRKGDK